MVAVERGGAAVAGRPRPVLQAILNHKDGSITAVFDRYGMDPEKVEALRLWGERVETIVDVGAPGAVVRFHLRENAS